MGIYDELQKINADSPTPKVTPKPKERKQIEVKKETKNSQSINQQTKQPVRQPVNRPTDPSISQFIDFDELGPVVEKPRAFYITQKVDRWLDEAVRYLQEKGL